VTAAETTALDDTYINLRKRWLLYAGWIVLSSLIFLHPLIAFVRMSLSNPDASHLILIPFISAWVLFVERQKIFLHLSSDKVLAGSFLFLASCAAFASRVAGSDASSDLQVSGYILSLALIWVAGFALLFGKAASSAGRFSLLFLFLMIPVPKLLLNYVIYLLQAGSAWITGVLFDLLGVPVLREGFVFHLARFNILVAEECSGIRSSMALLILALLAAHFRLRSFWKKIMFLACGLFLMILKNGIRIVSLTVLAMRVDPRFLYGKLHSQGGIVFFILSLLLLAPILWLLRRGEASHARDALVLTAQSPN
jgi:exosortase